MWGLFCGVAFALGFVCVHMQLHRLQLTEKMLVWVWGVGWMIGWLQSINAEVAVRYGDELKYYQFAQTPRTANSSFRTTCSIAMAFGHWSKLIGAKFKARELDATHVLDLVSDPILHIDEKQKKKGAVAHRNKICTGILKTLNRWVSSADKDIGPVRSAQHSIALCSKH